MYKNIMVYAYLNLLFFTLTVRPRFTGGCGLTKIIPSILDGCVFISLGRRCLGGYCRLAFAGERVLSLQRGRSVVLLDEGVVNEGASSRRLLGLQLSLPLHLSLVLFYQPGTPADRVGIILFFKIA